MNTTKINPHDIVAGRGIMTHEIQTQGTAGENDTQTNLTLNAGYMRPFNGNCGAGKRWRGLVFHWQYR